MRVQRVDVGHLLVEATPKGAVDDNERGQGRRQEGGKEGQTLLQVGGVEGSRGERGHAQVVPVVPQHRRFDGVEVTDEGGGGEGGAEWGG